MTENATENLLIRSISRDDLDAVNAIIESCVMSWNLPERVKRLVLGSYHYNLYDLEHFEILSAETAAGTITGVAALEDAMPSDLPREKSGLLLHGLYVAPEHQKQGIGSSLLEAALESSRKHGKNGLLVKSHADASGFFLAQGFSELPIENSKTDYPHRWWKTV
jgi:predicted N-acetyltransferase YhbS